MLSEDWYLKESWQFYKRFTTKNSDYSPGWVCLVLKYSSNRFWRPRLRASNRGCFTLLPLIFILIKSHCKNHTSSKISGRLQPLLHTRLWRMNEETGKKLHTWQSPISGWMGQTTLCSMSKEITEYSKIKNWKSSSSINLLGPCLGLALQYLHFYPWIQISLTFTKWLYVLYEMVQWFAITHLHLRWNSGPTFGRHGLSCKKQVGRHPRHSQVNNFIKHALSSANFPSRLAPKGLERNDRKCPYGLTLFPYCVELSSGKDVKN